MKNINILDEIKIHDKQNVYGSVVALPDQCIHAWEDASKVVIPESYKDIENVVMCGMGGSGLGARVVESLYFSRMKIPLIRINDYHIPSYINERSLVFVSSYSGNTEETVQNLNEAMKNKAKIIVIGAGGKLIDIAKEYKLPFYQITPTHNPSNQPRMAIGYSIVGQLVLASKTGILEIKKDEITDAIEVMKNIVDKNDIFKNENIESKRYADLMKGKVILYISSEHLIGATHVVNNQQNENAKNLSFDFSIPELNHHLMEGLKHPGVNNENILVYFFESELYSSRIQQRYEITEDVVEKNNIMNLKYKANSNDKFKQVFEIIQFGAFCNFYLTMLYGINPAPIPWVDFFKEKLGQPLGK
jgi:glucose/mannose-6-phosphate isomerase